VFSAFLNANDAKRTADVIEKLLATGLRGCFGGDPNVIGRIIQLNERPVEIVGVMPASFRFLYPENDLWGAFRLNRDQPWRETAGRFMSVVARMKPGLTRSVVASGYSLVVSGALLGLYPPAR
jgi:hypothetical protein